MQKLRVLIAEDKDIVASRLAAELETLGHKVVSIVTDAGAAADAAERSVPDLLLLGQNLPPYDGVEAARAILAKRVVPLILVIGYPAAGLVRRAQEAGVLAYLVWPAEVRMLEAAIQVAQSRFRELRILHEQAGNLDEALRMRTVVGRAKLLLMRRLEFAEADAFAYIYRQSRGMKIPVWEVAMNLIKAEDLVFGKSDFADCIDAILQVLRQPKVLGPIRVA
jgi:two-component system, response regulator PdtaR